MSWGCFKLLLYVMELFQVGIMRYRDVSGCYCMVWNCFRLVLCVMRLFQVVIVLWNCFKLVSRAMRLFHVVVYYGTVSGWYHVSWGCFMLLLCVMELFQAGIVCHGDVSQRYRVPCVKHIDKKDSCLQNKPHLWLFT